MTSANTLQIERAYHNAQQRYVIEQGSELLAKATQFSANYEFPVHRWFHFKEGFSADLLNATGVDIGVLKNNHSIFLDPFCGSGTTILAGDLQHKWQARRIGFEINPFLAFAASVKANWRLYNPERLRKFTQRFIKVPLREDIPSDLWPSLSTFHNYEMFLPRKVSQLIDGIQRVKEIKGPERELILLGIAAAVDKIGFYRKDGRALRILRSPEEIRRRTNLDLRFVLRDIWDSYEEDLHSLQALKENNVGCFDIICSDGRKIEFPPELKIRQGDVCLIAYSPPYLNHIDYTEVYKIELWLLEFISTSGQMLELRKKTLRSHGSYSFRANGNNLPETTRRIVELVSAEVEKTGSDWHKHFRDVAFGYLEDIQASLHRQYELLYPGGQVICVVANSAHGSKQHRIPVAVDLFIAELAKNVGFDISKFLIARKMRRRDSLNQYLRETVLVMRRPVT